MSQSAASIVLGSRSPRRRELLSLLVGPERVLVRPPRDAAEPSLDGAEDDEQLTARLLLLARAKNNDVTAQLQEDDHLTVAGPILTADTVIVGRGADDRLTVLGQPPASGDWQQTVREWFQAYYFDRPHQAFTAICLRLPDGSHREQVVATEIAFRPEARGWLEWYLSTGESIGKAGGYGIQGAASLFVERVDGSLSNVIGLPLHETANLLREARVLLETEDARER